MKALLRHPSLWISFFLWITVSLLIIGKPESAQGSRFIQDKAASGELGAVVSTSIIVSIFFHHLTTQYPGWLEALYAFLIPTEQCPEVITNGHALAKALPLYEETGQTLCVKGRIELDHPVSTTTLRLKGVQDLASGFEAHTPFYPLHSGKHQHRIPFAGYESSPQPHGFPVIAKSESFIHGSLFNIGGQLILDGIVLEQPRQNQSERLLKATSPMALFFIRAGFIASPDPETVLPNELIIQTPREGDSQQRQTPAQTAEQHEATADTTRAKSESSPSNLTTDHGASGGKPPDEDRPSDYTKKEPDSPPIPDLASLTLGDSKEEKADAPALTLPGKEETPLSQTLFTIGVTDNKKSATDSSERPTQESYDEKRKRQSERRGHLSKKR